MAGGGWEVERLGGGSVPGRAFGGREVSGVEVLVHRCGPGAAAECPARPGRLGVFLAAEGAGELRVGAEGEAFRTAEAAVLVPPSDYAAVRLRADGEGHFLVLELSLDLDAEDVAELAEQTGRAAIFRRHSECPKCQQSFKSAQTVSCFLLPPEREGRAAALHGLRGDSGPGRGGSPQAPHARPDVPRAPRLRRGGVG